MGTEIERTFRLDQVPGWLAGHTSEHIEQGYLAVHGDDTEVRVRRRDGQRLLTVKRGSGESRLEVEIELDDEQFDRLWPLTEERRLSKRRYVVPRDGVEVEVDVFEGKLRGVVVAEIEFDSEQESADFDPPAWLGEDVTGEPAFSNQALAMRTSDDGSGPSRAYRIKGGEDPADGLRRAAAGRLDDALDQLSGRGEPDAAVAVHETRKDLKKTRSILRLVRHRIGDDVYRRENDRFRATARLLAGARDSQVKLETLEALAAHYPGETPEAGRAAYARALEAEAADPDEARVARARRELEDGRAEIESWPLGRGEWDLVAGGISRSYRLGRKRLDDVRAEPGDEQVHEWRKRVKDLWYHLRLLQGSWRPVLGVTADEVHALADLLGDHHDLAVLREDLRSRQRLVGESDLERFEELMGRRQDELLGDALELAERLYAEKPKRFIRRLHRYWQAWR